MSNSVAVEMHAQATDLLPTTIQDRFQEFDAKHPEVFDLFVAFSRELLTAGHESYSADAILHRIRWHFDVNEKRDSGFKINNNFSSRYARKLAAINPIEFGSFFRFRNLRSW